MSRVLEAIAALPWGIHAAVAFATAAGLVVWLMGQRFVRPVIVALGLALGAMLGSMIVPLLGGGDGAGFMGLSANQGLLIGAFVGAVAGLLLWRSAQAVAMGMVMAVLLPLVAATVLHFRPVETWDGGSGDVAWGARASETFDDIGDRWEGSREEAAFGVVLASMRSRADGFEGGEGTSALAPAEERVRTAAGEIRERVKEQWSSLPAANRSIIVLAGIIGMASGVMLGLARPSWGAGAATAMFGSAVWLSGVVWLSNAMGAPWREQFDRGPVTWLIVWGCAAALGMLVQWSGFFGKKKAASAPAAA